MERRLITGTTTLGLRYSMLNLEEGTRGECILIMMRAVGSNVVCIHDLQPFRFGTRRRIADFTTFVAIVEIVGW
jgi:hypothetical protein